MAETDRRYIELLVSSYTALGAGVVITALADTWWRFLGGVVMCWLGLRKKTV